MLPLQQLKYFAQNWQHLLRCLQDFLQDPTCFDILSEHYSRLFLHFHPTLKATENFTKLQGQLEGIENNIKNSRKVFNDEINIYNTKVRSFPMNILGGIFGFKAKEGFKADAGAEKKVDVNFDDMKK